VEYTKRVDAAFEIIAESNRSAILSLLVWSQQSAGEIERQLRMPQPTVSKYLGGSLPFRKPATLHTALWTLPQWWGAFFSLTGFGKVRCYKPALWNQALQEVPWFSAVPEACSSSLGSLRFVVGLLAPSMTESEAHALAAFGLTRVMILAAVFNNVRCEYHCVPIQLVLGRASRSSCGGFL
jgi:hypothetical protein